MPEAWCSGKPGTTIGSARTDAPPRAMSRGATLSSACKHNIIAPRLNPPGIPLGHTRLTTPPCLRHFILYIQWEALFVAIKLKDGYKAITLSTILQLPVFYSQTSITEKSELRSSSSNKPTNHTFIVVERPEPRRESRSGLKSYYCCPIKIFESWKN